MPKETKQTNPADLLAKIHDKLQDEDAQIRLQAIQKLLEQKFSSPAILHTIEKLALNDKSKNVREAARKALDTPTHRYIQGRTTDLTRFQRQSILAEIVKWEDQGLIRADQVDVLRQRYDFDQKTAAQPLDLAPAPKPEPAPAIKTPPTPKPVERLKPAPEKPAKPATPRPSLTQTLLSETSIKIALYLGAFFVIAAAAILAAVVEAARLPILFVATALFGGGALVTQKRLPQPSFALFVVFSFLLPTDANVLADVLNLTGTVISGYWAAIMMLMALIWGFGTWYYASRLFSLAAFVALVISVIRLGELFSAEPEIYLLLLSVTTFIGLGGVYYLSRWQSAKFSQSLFILAQLFHLGLIAFALIAVFLRLEDFPSAWNLAGTLFWLLAAVFYFFSDMIYPFALFPWLAAAALYPVSLVFLLAFDVEAPLVSIATWIWGALLALGSEVLRRMNFGNTRRYVLPLVTGSILVILTAIFIGILEAITYGFALMVGSAVLYTVIHVLKPRAYIWVAALLSGIGAYFSFFALPFMEKIDINNGYQFLGVSLLLLLPDLFMKPDFSVDKIWRWPLRIPGTFLAFLNIALLLPFSTANIGHAALAYGIYAIFITAYALRYNAAWIGYLATACLAMAATFALQNFDLDAWLPVLTGLAATYYLGGWALKRKTNKWSGMLRISGLGLGALVALIALVGGKDSSGWYILVVGALFTTEMFIRQNGWLETGPGFFFPVALVLLLQEFKVESTGYFLLGLSLLWLTLDLVFGRTFHGKRPLSWPMRGLGALLVAGNTLNLMQDTGGSHVAWICFGSYTLFFLIYALVHKKPLLGYAFTTFLPLTILYLLRDLRQDNWLLPMMAPALVYYLVGFVLTRSERLAGWGQMMRISGLGLGALVSLTGVITSQESSGWYALITALLFTVEMFSRRKALSEAGVQLFFAIGVFSLLQEAGAAQGYQWLGVSLALLGTDLALARTYKNRRSLAWFSRGFGALFVVINSLDILPNNSEVQVSAICFAIYMLFFLVQALLYRLPVLGYVFTLYSVLTVITALKAFDLNNWLLPVTALAIAFYTTGFFLRRQKPENPVQSMANVLSLSWPFVLWTSGLGAGLLATIVAPSQGGLSAAIPVAVTATMVAVEAFDRRNVWLGFPANALYLMAYFILLAELNVDEPQFFSIATAALGLLMHYLLTRAGSRTGAFITGMVSQLALLGTTYIQFLSTEGPNGLVFFAVIFFQALAVLVYGIIIRSRSLVITPIIFAVLSVTTVLYGLLQGILPVILIGCTGLILLMLGIFAVIMRDRFKQIGERFNDWGA